MKLILVLICFVVIVFADHVWSGEAKIYAGIEQTNITPPVGGKTTGYSSAEPAVAIHDPLYAKVLVLNSATQSIAIVIWDLCVFGSPWLHEQMESIGIDHLVILNTHTHAGANLNQQDFPSSEKPWRKTVEERVFQAIQTAQKNMFPAYFSVNQGNIQLGYNRLVRQPGGYSITHFENPDRIPYGPVDPTVGVIRITDDAEKIRCVLICYACHPVVLGPRNREISADFPGVLSREVVHSLGEGVQCMFVQGGAGDINPLILARTGDPELDFPLVERVGQLLAEEVVQTVERMKNIKGESNQFSFKHDIIQTQHRFEPDTTIPLSVTSILINNQLGIISMPGEPFHLFQQEVRNKSDLPHTFLFGYCGNATFGWPQYIPDLQSAARGGYGASDSTIVEVGAGERIVNRGLVMLYEMRNRLLDHPQRHVEN